MRSTKKLQNVICERLRHISYNRWAQYWNSRYAPVADIPQRRFLPDTYWEDIEAIYMFDRRVRNLLFDAIARVEISLRVTIAQQWAKISGKDSPHSRQAYYELKRRFTSGSGQRGNGKCSYDYMMSCAEKEFKRAKRRQHLAQKQMNAPDVSHLPIWDFMDLCTFGPLSDLISEGLTDKVVIPIAHTFGFQNIQEFRSVISLLHDVRNACAHQGRVWNRLWLTAQGTPHLKAPQRTSWPLVLNLHSNAGTENASISDGRKTAAALAYCCYILKYIAPQSGWKHRCKALLLAPENADFIAELGFAEHWDSHPLWK